MDVTTSVSPLNPDLLFKGCWSGSQHVLSSRERELTGKGGKKTKEKNLHTCQGHCMTSCSPGCGQQKEKNPPGIKWRGGEKSCWNVWLVPLYYLLDGFVACFGTSQRPMTTESCSEVVPWYTLIHFRSPEFWNLGFVQWSGFWRTLPEPVCAGKKSSALLQR